MLCVWAAVSTVGAVGQRQPRAEDACLTREAEDDGHPPDARSKQVRPVSPGAAGEGSKSQNVVVNKYLKVVAEGVDDQLEVEMPRLTFHGARHAWADLARRSGRDLHEIRTAMKHSGLSVTEQYFASGEGEIVDAEIPT